MVRMRLMSELLVRTLHGGFDDHERLLSPCRDMQPTADCALNGDGLPGLLVAYAKSVLAPAAGEFDRSRHGLVAVLADSLVLDVTPATCSRVYALYRANGRAHNPDRTEPVWGPARSMVARAAPYWVFQRLSLDGTSLRGGGDCDCQRKLVTGKRDLLLSTSRSSPTLVSVEALRHESLRVCRRRKGMGRTRQSNLAFAAKLVPAAERPKRDGTKTTSRGPIHSGFRRSPSCCRDPTS